MSEYLIHERVQSLGKGAYQRLASGGRWNHSRQADWVGTFGARAASWFFPDVLWRVTPRSANRFGVPQAAGKRTLYLTIDDGPTADGTLPLLEVLDRFGVRTTMFLVGRNARQNPGLVREIVAAGHSIGNHTETHLDAWTSVYAKELADQVVKRNAHLRDPLTVAAVRIEGKDGNGTLQSGQGFQLADWPVVENQFKARSNVD